METQLIDINTINNTNKINKILNDYYFVIQSVNEILPYNSSLSEAPFMCNYITKSGIILMQMIQDLQFNFIAPINTEITFRIYIISKNLNKTFAQTLTQLKNFIKDCEGNSYNTINTSHFKFLFEFKCQIPITSSVAFTDSDNQFDFYLSIHKLNHHYNTLKHTHNYYGMDDDKNENYDVYVSNPALDIKQSFLLNLLHTTL